MKQPKPLFVVVKDGKGFAVKHQKGFRQPGKFSRTTINVGHDVASADQLAAELNAAVEWYVRQRGGK